MSGNCVFCKIVQGDIPAVKLYEDDEIVTFFDISQVTKGHALVIPKAHHADIFSLPEKTAATLFAAVPKLASALKAEFAPVGMNILNNNGEAAGQTVFHYHLHLLPRYGETGLYGSLWKEATVGTTDMESLQASAEKIKMNL